MTAKKVGDLRFSQSVASLYQRCGFLFKTQELEGIRPRYTPAPLRRGTLVAAALEAARRAHHSGIETLEELTVIGRTAIYLKHQEWMDEEHIAKHVTDELRQDFAEQTEQSNLIFARALEFIGLHEGKWETVCLPDGTALIEHEMSVPFPGFAEGYGGKLDWVARETETGYVWIWDDKTHKRINPEDYYETQLQIGGYIHLLRVVHGIDIKGNIMFQMRAHVPDVPKMNTRKGKGQDKPGMSRGQCATDWKTYRQALLDNDLDPDDYQDIRFKLAPFDRMDRYYRTDKEVESVWETIQSIGRRLLAEKEFPRILNPYGCMACKLKSYCLADLRGHDTDFLAKTEYVREGEESYFPAVFLEDNNDEG